MMKKLQLLFIALILAMSQFAFAQTENDPCTAPCLSFSGSTSGQDPAADGFFPNQNLPCGAGTSEDNPTWYTFVPSGSSFTINLSVGGCSSGTSVQVTFFSGDDCGSVGSAGCLNCVTGGSLTLATIPGKQYWIQVDGCAEAVCSFTLSYDPNQLLKIVPPPIVTGPINVCKGTTQEYTAMIPGGIKPSNYTWTITPSSGGQVLPPNNEETVQVKWNSVGTFKLCAKPKFNVKCPPSQIGTGCIDVVVTELKQAACSITLCPEDVPYDYKLMPCIQTANPGVVGTPDPDDYTITQGAGTTKITSIPYVMSPSGCSGKVVLTSIVKPKAIKGLPPMIICEDDSVKVGSKWLKCADAKAGAQNYVVEYNPKPQYCDTTYSFFLQCIKINPIVSPANPILDCINTSVTLKAGSTVFLPNSTAANPGIKSYQWGANANNATTPDVTVTAAGTYCVTISYEYTLTANGTTVTKKCSKVKCVTVTGSGTNPPPPTPIALNPYPCLADTASYTVSVATGTTYDWTVTGGTPATFSGNIINVKWAATGPYKICAVAKNVCGTSTPGCLNITLNPPPTLPVIVGASPVCQKDTAKYSVTPIKTPNAKYTWTLPAGASFLGKQDTSTITVIWSATATTGDITCIISDKCGSSPKAVKTVIVNLLPAAPTGITGKLNTCKNDKIDYTVNPLVQYATDYIWTVKGGTITSNMAGDSTKMITVMWTTKSDTNKVCVNAINNCDPIGKKYCITVNTQDFPIANAGSSKENCGLVSPLNASLKAGNTGKWTSLTGSPGTATFDDNTKPKANVTVTACGMYSFVWTETNTAGCSGKDTINVTFTDNPTTMFLVTTCDPVAKTYNLKFNVVGCLAPYNINVNVPKGYAPQVLSVAPYTFELKDVPQASNKYNIAIQAGACTITLADSVNCNCVTKAGEMDLLATQTACSAGANTITAIHKAGTEFKDKDDVTAYILYEGNPSSYTKIIAANHTGKFTFNPAMMKCGQTYYIGFLVGNNDGTGYPSLTDPCFKLTPVNQEVRWDCVPKPNAGTDQTICGLSAIMNAATPAAGVTGKWTGPVGSSFGSISSPTSTVTIAPPAGLYTFTWTETNGKCKDSATVNITFKQGTLTTSKENYTCDGTNDNYTVKFDVSGGAPPYKILDCTTKTVIATLSNAPYSFTSAPVKSGATYCFKVTDANNCDTITVSKSYACGCTTEVGSITVPAEVCVGTTLAATSLKNDKFDTNDTFEFLLTDNSNPKDPAITIFDRNQTGKFDFDPAKLKCDKQYVLLYVVGNKNAAGTGVKFDDPCLGSTYKNVTFLCIPFPTTGIKTVDTCAQKVFLSGSVGAGSWSYNGPSTNVKFEPSNTDPNAIATGVSYGNWTFTWTQSNKICKDSSNKLLNLISPSTLAHKEDVICDAANKFYTLSVDLTGSAPFKIDLVGSTAPGKITGNQFVSSPIESGKKVTLSFKDNVSCIPVTYDYEHTCPCESNAGAMDVTQIELCQGSDALVTKPAAITGVKLDGDDTAMFVLHEGPVATLQNAITIVTDKDKATFKFDPAKMKYDKLYYISYVVGDKKANNEVDLTYFCKSVSKGTPVIWHATPTISIGSDATICKGGSTEINFTMTGKASFEISYFAGTFQKPLISKNNITTLPVNPTETTVYKFTKVIDDNKCFLDFTKDITITVNEVGKSGIPSPDRRSCFGTGNTIDMNTEITGADPGGVWSVSPATNFNPSTGEFKPQGAATGTYTFTYTVKGKKPCPDVSTSVKYTVDPVPQADAGVDKELNCDNTEIVLGTTSSYGANVQFSWITLDGSQLANPSIKNPTTKTAGKFLMEVRDKSSNCFSFDTVIVKKDLNKIDSATFRTIQPNCYGEDNGVILVNKISGGTPPYQFAINNGSYVPFKNFQNLKAGKYSIKMKDNKGCTFQDSVLVNQPYQIDVDLGEDKDIQLGETADLEAQINFPEKELKKLIWYPQCDTCKKLTLVVKPQETTLYGITVINNKGCVAKDNILVRVNKPRHVYIPNVFYPDSENDRNRKLKVFLGLDVLKVEFFRIYDRWGDIVHEDLDFTRDQVYQNDKGWDGNLRGIRAQPGVYTYACKVVFVDGYTEIYKGDCLMILK